MLGGGDRRFASRNVVLSPCFACVVGRTDSDHRMHSVVGLGDRSSCAAEMLCAGCVVDS